jgi:hypothetical protein
MPTLILPPRYTPDSIALSKAAVRAGWDVERLTGWQVPQYLVGQEVFIPSAGANSSSRGTKTIKAADFAIQNYLLDATSQSPMADWQSPTGASQL